MAKTKYDRWYDWIIQRAAGRTASGYVERHHIVPRALGGSNARSNIVRLTYREHFLAHWLLTKMTEGAARKKMQHALYRMSGSFKGRTIAGWQYAVARQAQRNARLGSKASDQHRAKIAASLRGNKNGLGYRFTDAQRQISSASKRGNKHSLGYKHGEATLKKRPSTMSPETRARMTASQKRRWAERKRSAAQSELVF